MNTLLQAHLRVTKVDFGGSRFLETRPAKMIQLEHFKSVDLSPLESFSVYYLTKT